MFTAAKDRAAAQAAKAYLNHLLRAAGEVRELEIDSRQGRIGLTCALLGEAETVGITIERYVIVREPDGARLLVHASSATRPWLAAALRVHLHDRPIVLPGWAAAALG